MDKRKTKLELTFPEKILREAQRHGYRDLLLTGRLVVAVSGGADSIALLLALLALRGADAKQSLHVAHIEHGFRGAEGEGDAQFVATVAQEHGLRCTIHHVDVPALASRLHLSPEDAARRARYGFLAKLAHAEDAIIAVAHTADDQAETMLMSILRGAGLAGIAGMQPLAEMRFPLRIEASDAGEDCNLDLQVFRPMLSTWRADVEQYCREIGITPRTDSTNAERTYTRNRLRLDLLPSLQAHYNPAIKEHLANLAEIASGEESLLEQYADDVWQSVATYSGDRDTLCVEASIFAGLHIAMQRRLARRAIAAIASTLEGVSFQHISSIVSAFGEGAENVPTFHLPHNIAVEVVAGQGIIRKRPSRDKRSRGEVPDSRNWPLISRELDLQPIDQEITLERDWVLTTSIAPEEELDSTPGALIAHFDLQAISKIGPLVLRPRHAGDSIQPLGMAGRKSLQDLYVDAKIPRMLRDYLVVLTCSGSNDVLWVPGPGGRRSSQALVSHDTAKVFQLTFTRETGTTR